MRRASAFSLVLVLLFGPTVGSALDLADVIDRLENGTSGQRKNALQEIANDPPADFALLLDPLLVAAGDPDPETRFQVLVLAAASGRFSIEDGQRLGTVTAGLRGHLADADVRIRSVAAEALALTQPFTPAAATGDLHTLLSDSEPTVRVPAAMGVLRLETIDDSERDAVLALLTNDPESSVRSEVAALLSRVPKGGGVAVNALIAALADSNSTVRLNAANALAFYGSAARPAQSTLQALAASDPDPEVRGTAQLAENTIENSNSAPDCISAITSLTSLWPPNKKFTTVQITGTTDPDGDPVNVAIDGVTQDEIVGGNCPDATINGSSVELRREREGGGDGRVYRIGFTATDSSNASCSAELLVCVPHDQGLGETCTDGGVSHDSLQCD